MTRHDLLPRRRFLAGTARCGAAALALPLALHPGAARAAPGPRELLLHHTHTGERLQVVFALGERYLAPALAALDRLLRDHRDGQVGRMDPLLFDQIHRVQAALGFRGPVEVISAWRSERTNERLRERGGGGVARRSLHLQGRAIDIRLPGVPLAELRDAAVALGAGGVGYYPAERFVHLDTGRVRGW